MFGSRVTARSRVLALIAVVACTAGFASTPPQPAAFLARASIAPSPLLGTWNLEWEIGRRVAGGETGSIMARGTMIVTAAGDSLLAAMTMHSRDDGGTVSPPFTMRGMQTDSGATFTRESQASMSVNGDAQRQTVTSTWTLRAQGDSLTGTIARDLPGMLRGTMRSTVRGTRVRS